MFSRRQHAASTPCLPLSAGQQALAGSLASASLAPHLFGYGNRFHTHAAAGPHAEPPSYESSVGGAEEQKHQEQPQSEELPAYTCTLAHAGPVSFRVELDTPFTLANGQSSDWTKAWAEVEGTKLSLYRAEKGKKGTLPGKLIRTYTLQHAVAGMALDVRPSAYAPPKILACFSKEAARKRHEWVLRLRVETYQLLISCPTESSMLDWVDVLCTSIDIAQPLEVREEPRYKSLPRRRRRQRALERGAMGHDSAYDAEERQERRERLIRQQEHIIRDMYPGLLVEGLLTSESRPSRPVSRGGEGGGVYEAEGLDASDILAPEGDVAASLSKDGAQPDLSESQLIRYRRRCAPILLATSPRSSDIIIYNGRRVRIDSNRSRLREFSLLPPAYQSHEFSNSSYKLAAVLASNTPLMSDTEMATGAETTELGAEGRPHVRRELTNMTVESTASQMTIDPSSSPSIDDLDISNDLALSRRESESTLAITPAKGGVIVLKADTRRSSLVEAGKAASMLLAELERRAIQMA